MQDESLAATDLCHDCTCSTLEKYTLEKSTLEKYTLEKNSFDSLELIYNMIAPSPNIFQTTSGRHLGRWITDYCMTCLAHTFTLKKILSHFYTFMLNIISFYCN